MHMLYDSESFVVVQIHANAPEESAPAPTRCGPGACSGRRDNHKRQGRSPGNEAAQSSPEENNAKSLAASGVSLGTLCITLASLWQPDPDGPQGVFLQSIAPHDPRKTTQQTARVWLITGRRELCRGFLGHAARGNVSCRYHSNSFNSFT